MLNPNNPCPSSHYDSACPDSSERCYLKCKEFKATQPVKFKPATDEDFLTDEEKRDPFAGIPRK
jgi:hypothetical protein